MNGLAVPIAIQSAPVANTRHPWLYGSLKPFVVIVENVSPSLVTYISNPRCAVERYFNNLPNAIKLSFLVAVIRKSNNAFNSSGRLEENSL